MNRREAIRAAVGAIAACALPAAAQYDRVTVRGERPRLTGKIDVVMWNGSKWVVCGHVDFDDYLVPGEVIDISSDGTVLRNKRT